MRKLTGMLVIGMICQAGLVMAAEPIIYPANNQNEEQLAKDSQECRQWAIEQSSFDPAAPPTQPVQESALPKKARDSNVLKGTVAGAAVGGLGGSMGGKFGKGAVAGAAVGMAAGAIKDHKETSQTAQTPPADNLSSAEGEKYKKAYSACLEGRGYTVKF